MTICGKEVRFSARSGLPALIALALALVCAGTKAGATWGATAYDAASDPYSMDNITNGLGATSWWNAGYTGKGIDVALIDTGVSPVAGLNVSGKVAYGPDLSLESQNTAFRNLDTFGHGTFMAGLIAGRDSTAKAPYASNPASTYLGVAPDARIVSLKVGTADGGVDVSQVIAAIDWVVQHAHDKGFNIRVINLSYGTNSLQDYSADPLAYAVEQAWKKGIVVVAAAGNSGFQKYQTAPGLADPAYDPFVIAVGGADTMGTADSGDDTVGDYSANAAACNTDCRAPDFIAPGSHMQGLRVPNSYIDVNHPEGRIDTRYFRGSGTSEATAITSGAVALILQRYPNMTPDQVKDFLSRSTDGLCGVNKKMAGFGELDLGLAYGMSTASSYVPWFVPSSGSGSLEISRGTDHISRNGVVLQGEQDIFGKTFNSSSIASLEAAGASWSGGTWNGSTWSGSSWSGSTWSGATWSGASWSGASWSGMTWSGNSWSGSTWSGSSWSGNSWSGASWSGNSWSGGSWQGATWG